MTGLETTQYKIGDKGPGVKKLIQALADKGYYNAKVDAYYGIAAQDAYEAFLADAGCASKASE